jgi:4-amino-4-deoxy-L-arabinose transferase-like glycosyltransferase
MNPRRGRVFSGSRRRRPNRRARTVCPTTLLAVSVPRSRWWLFLALLAHGALAGGYAVRTPAWEGPDESDHAYYATFLAATGRQPIILGSAEQTGRPTHEEASLGHHPPLYYWLLGQVAAFCGHADVTPYWSPSPEWATTRPTAALKWQHGHDETTHASAELWVLRAQRAVSVLLGAVTITLAYALARALAPARPQVAAWAALVLAAWPQWSFMHGVLDNGNLATTLATATTLLLVRAVQRSAFAPRGALALGLLLGTALVTKLTALFLLPLVAGTLALAWWTSRAPLARLLAFGALAATVALAISGAWFWRNYDLYGDPLALAPHAVAYATNRVPEGLRWSYLTGDFVPRSLHSLFAAVGWASRGAPPAVELGALAFVLLGAFGCAWRLRSLGREHGLALLVLVGSIALTAAGLVQFNLTFVQPQGRYLFPALAALAVLLAIGLDAARLPVWLAVGCIAGALALQHAWFLPQLQPGVPPSPHYASYVSGLRAAPDTAVPALEALAPPHDHAATEPPQFAWRDAAAPANVVYTVQLAIADGPTFGTFETMGLAIPATTWAMPAAMWATMPRDRLLRWRVRRVADRARGEGALAQPCSPWLTLHRR